MKQSTVIILFIVLVAGISILVREAFPKRVITPPTLDTIWVPASVPPLNVDSIPAVVSIKRELVRVKYDRNEWKRWAEIYEHMNYTLRDSVNWLNGVVDSLSVITATIDTVLPPYGDTLNVKYKFPPVNLFSIGYFPSPRPQSIITQYIEVPMRPSFWSKIERYTYFGVGLLSGYGIGRLQSSFER